MLRRLYILLLILLTIYAPLELTRYIFAYGIDRELIVELSIMWALYVSAMVIIPRLLRSRK